MSRATDFTFRWVALCFRHRLKWYFHIFLLPFLCFACEITHFSIFIIVIKEIWKWHSKRHFTWKVHVQRTSCTRMVFSFSLSLLIGWHLGNSFFWPQSVSVDWVNCNSFCIAPLNMIDVEGCTHSNSKRKKKKQKQKLHFLKPPFLNAGPRYALWKIKYDLLC